MWSAAIALSMGIAGCNLFHPTGSHDAENGDAAALTLEGYQEFQKANYDAARGFFNRAIRADSGYSEAWIGLCKSILNTQKGLNVFELVSYARKTEKKDEENKESDGKSSSSSSNIGFLDMSDAKADTISRGIDSVMFYLDQFVERDTTDRTDKKVTFADIADSYTILQLTKAGIRLRNVHTQLTSVVSADNAGMQMNLNTLNDLGDSLKPFLQDMAAAAEAIKASPESAAEIIKAYLPDSTRKEIGDEFYADATVGLANTVIQLNDRAQTIEEDRTEVFFTFGNVRDDDGDGCIDEEVVDNYDNDGDGEIDEDARDYRVVVLVKNPSNLDELIAQGKDAKMYDLTKAQVDSLKLIEKYTQVDIDWNGKNGAEDSDEWHYVIRDPEERDKSENHLLKFALDLSFPGSDLDKKIEYKEKARKDTIYDPENKLPKYDLQWRKDSIGGCWKNYNDDDFKKWFEGRNAK